MDTACVLGARAFSLPWLHFSLSHKSPSWCESLRPRECPAGSRARVRLGQIPAFVTGSSQLAPL